ncbi:DoxX family protein [Paludibacterium paludis]|uniref:Membrane protein n=1 Tax=Paludibacterium paludis TaxID=1225769 RepID=A0A918P6J0_9NEIS|nr:DoxX family protein [Paludibacterium paludis]GGY28262.1 membrane protein [Paludibacterium paludis]
MIDTRTAPYAAFVLRLALGTMFLAHGLTKVLVFTLPGTAQFFESVGFPGFLAYPVAFAEVGGGALLLLGIAPRLVAALLLPVLIGASTVHFANGWSFANPNGGWEYPVFLVIAALVQALVGDGALTLKSTASLFGNRR